MSPKTFQSNEYNPDQWHSERESHERIVWEPGAFPDPRLREIMSPFDAGWGWITAVILIALVAVVAVPTVNNWEQTRIEHARV